MKPFKWPLVAAAIASASFIASVCGESTKISAPSTQPAMVDDLGSVSPALVTYRDDVVLGDLWNRPGLSPRDRSVITVSALITRNQTVEMPHYFASALDNGVTTAELSEIITHLAFYAGWPNAMSAVVAAKGVFTERGVSTGDLPDSSGAQLPLDEAGEAQRQTTNQDKFGDVSLGVLQFTTDLLFRDLWRRPGLAPRDRSLVTVSALVASGQTVQITYHLGRAMDNGLTQEQAGEALTQLAFYTGWPNVFSALPVVKDVFTSRTK